MNKANEINTIVFLLPFGIDRPSGGTRIIYDYANRLAHVGYHILIYQACYFGKYQTGVKRLMKSFAKYAYAITQKGKKSTWYNFNNKVSFKSCWEYGNNNPPADAVIATTAHTAPYLNNWSIDNNRKFYFIQGYETWNLCEKDLLDTFHYKMNKIVVSKWLKNMMNELGEKSFLVLNGFDFNEFFLTVPIENKDKYCVTMLYHPSPLKDLETGFRALDIVKDKIPELHVSLFGATSKPDSLPSWYSYYQLPDQQTHNKINNKAAIYLGTSKSEGWGLTVGEAMICGQAVVCTDNKGFLEMAENNENALVARVGDAEMLAGLVIELINNDEKRNRLATKANISIKGFDRSKSAIAFADYIVNTISKVN